MARKTTASLRRWLTACTLLLVGLGLLLARPMPLRMGGLHEVTQATPWDELFIEAEPLPEAGPVAVEVGYRIAPGTDAATPAFWARSTTS